jgi:hypothetical protein
MDAKQKTKKNLTHSRIVAMDGRVKGEERKDARGALLACQAQEFKELREFE